MKLNVTPVVVPWSLATTSQKKYVVLGERCWSVVTTGTMLVPLPTGMVGVAA